MDIKMDSGNRLLLGIRFSLPCRAVGSLYRSSKDGINSIFCRSSIQDLSRDLLWVEYLS